jgi:hypothetical protein
MWHEDSAAFLRVHPWISARHVHHLKCTAEHLVACQDGGPTTADNIAAACSWCNTMRHQGRPHKAPNAARYKEQVVRLVSLGRWHPVAPGVHARKTLPVQRGWSAHSDCGTAAASGRHAQVAVRQ